MKPKGPTTTTKKGPTLRVPEEARTAERKERAKDEEEAEEARTELRRELVLLTGPPSVLRADAEGRGVGVQRSSDASTPGARWLVQSVAVADERAGEELDPDAWRPMAPTNGVVWFARNWEPKRGRDAARPERYLVFAVDDDKREATLVNPGFRAQVLSELMPWLENPPQVESQADANASSALAALVDEYGSKRRRKAMQERALATITGSNVAKFASVDQGLSTRFQEQEQEAAAAAEASAAAAAAAGTDLEEPARPRHNPDARTPDQVYLRDSYFPESHILSGDFLRSELAKVELSLPEKIEAAGTPSPAAAAAASVEEGDDKPTAAAAAPTRMHAGALGAFVYSTKGGHAAVEADENAFKDVVFYGLLVRFLKLFRGYEGASVREREAWAALMGISVGKLTGVKVPQAVRDVAKSFLERFGKANEDRFELRKPQRDRLLMVLMVVALSLSDFALDAEKLAMVCRDLHMTRQELEPYLWEVGAHPVKLEGSNERRFVLKPQYVKDRGGGASSSSSSPAKKARRGR